MKLISFIVCCLLSFSYFTQEVVSGEYFFDTDPEVGKGTAFVFTPATNIEHSLSISTAGLTPGFHNLFVRVKNSKGIWGHHEGRLFFVLTPKKEDQQTSFISAEYFFDTDPGIGNGTPFNVSSLQPNTILNVSTQNLVEGFHNLFVRVKNNQGLWSHYEGRMFYVLSKSNIGREHV